MSEQTPKKSVSVSSSDCDEQHSSLNTSCLSSLGDSSNANSSSSNEVLDECKARFMIFSSQLLNRTSKTGKWKKVQTLLFNDLIAFTTGKLSENKLSNLSSYSGYIKHYILLRDVVKCNFDLYNNEFQVVYLSKSAHKKYRKVNLKACSIEEKHTWTKLLSQRIKQSKKYQV